MDLIKKTITARLLNKLPSDKKFIDPQWLNGYDIPGFVVERIKFELNRNLEESIVTPRTDWADMNSDAVRDAWYQFVDALESETRLPVEFAGTVIENAVGDILNLLVEPRKYLPDYLFGKDETLDFRQVSDRVRNIVVYTHFGLHLPNYMQRKQLDIINRERFSSFICQLDEKLTSQYSPLNWAQLLAPLFELTNHTLEPELIARFFRDKERDTLVRKFDKIDEKINQARFIEILTASEIQPQSVSVSVPVPVPDPVSKPDPDPDPVPVPNPDPVNKTEKSAKSETPADNKTDVKPSTKTDPVPLFISDNDTETENIVSGKSDKSGAEPGHADVHEKSPAKEPEPEPESESVSGTDSEFSIKSTDFEPEPVEIPEQEPVQEPEPEPEPAVSRESMEKVPVKASATFIDEEKETHKNISESVTGNTSTPDTESRTDEVVVKKTDSEEKPAIPEPSQTRSRSSGIEFSSSSADSAAQPSAVPSAPQSVTSTPLWEKFRNDEDEHELKEEPDSHDTVSEPDSKDSDPADADPLWKKFQPDAEEKDKKESKPADTAEPKRINDTYARTAAQVRSQQLDKIVTKPAVAETPSEKIDDVDRVDPQSGRPATSTASPANESIEEIPLVDRFKPSEKAAAEKPNNRIAAQDSVPDFTDGTDGEQLPMWKRFISAAKGSRTPSDPETDSRGSSIAGSYTSDDSDLDIEISNPLRIDEITKTLENKKKYYIKRFFRGDHAAFNTVIRDLSEMDSWNEAGPYITRNVFKKNNIDPYSDEAVNFIDRLQSYFTAQNQK